MRVLIGVLGIFVFKHLALRLTLYALRPYALTPLRPYALRLTPYALRPPPHALRLTPSCWDYAEVW